jgi:hypothetical protein
MFQAMFAHHLADKLGACVVSGVHIPELGIDAGAFDPVPREHLRIAGHKININDVARKLKSRGVDCIVSEVLGMRFEYHKHNREAYRKLFGLHKFISRHEGFGDDHLVINIRTAEIMSGIHPDYAPLPLDFYDLILSETLLKPVFMGQIHDHSRYGSELCRRFPTADFLIGRTPLEDLACLLSARNICMSISSFCWLGAWLSDANSIHMPIYGLYNPAQRPDINLVPIDDTRYVYYRFPVQRWSAESHLVDDLFNGNSKFETSSRAEICKLIGTHLDGPMSGR